MDKRQAIKAAKELRERLGCSVSIEEEVWAYEELDHGTKKYERVNVCLYFSRSQPGIGHFINAATLQDALAIFEVNYDNK